MANRRVRSTGALVMMFLCVPVLALADTVQGRVLGATSTKLTMAVYDSQGRLFPNALPLKVDSRTRLVKIPSVTKLRKQDPISVDVRQEKSGLWRADTITKLQEAGPVQRSMNPTSPSLIDALKSPTGQKIIRYGLTGALTGAVASGASGGKAGKGALIGAGAGIAGGLLADMFSQRSQPQTSSAPVVTVQEDARQ